MNLLCKRFWIFPIVDYRKVLQYDYRFNASFRGKDHLSRIDLSRYEIKYIRLYRRAQFSRGTIWFRMFYSILKSFGLKTGIGLHDNLDIPRGLIIGHAGTIVISAGASFKGNIMLTHGVTIGRDIRGRRAGAPSFGENVCIRCNSTVVGRINIGDDVLIAPNTFVNFDVPSHSIVIGNPAVIHHRENATEGHIGKISCHND